MNSDEEEAPVGQYTDANRVFLQTFLARGSLTFKVGRSVLAKIFTVQEDRHVAKEEITQADFESFVSAAASALQPFDYSIRSTFHQVTNERIWALINITSDPLTQLATIRTADELAYIKRLLDLLFETNNTRRKELMAFTGMEAVKVAKAPSPASQRNQESPEEGESPPAARPTVNSITQTLAEKILEQLVTEGWFEKSQAGFYTLTPRALMELKDWLKASYNDEDVEEGEWQRIKGCAHCKEIVTSGQRCDDRECNVRLHDHCLENYWRTAGRRAGGGRGTQVGKNCACGREWKGRDFVGERVLTTGEKWQQGRGRRSGGGRQAAEEEEEEEEDEEMEEEEEDVGRGGEEEEEEEEEDADADGDADEDDN